MRGLAFALVICACGDSGGGVAVPSCSEGQVILDDRSGATGSGIWGGNVAVDARGVYYTYFNFNGTGGEHAVVRQPLAGGTVEVLWSGPDVEIFGKGMAVADRVYFSAALKGFSSTQVLAVPVAGGSLQMLGAFPDMQAVYHGVAVDAQNVYAGNGTALVKVPRAGGAAVAVLPPTGEGVEWVAGKDGTAYFVTSKEVMKVGADNTPVMLAPVGGFSLAIDGNTAYVLTMDSVVAVPLDGSAMTTLASGLTNTGVIAADSSGVYFSANDNAPQMTAAIYRISPGQPPVALAENIAVWQLATNETTVYWAGLGQVGRVGKCSK